MLAEAESGLSPLYQGCKTNRDNWEKIQQEHDKLSKLNFSKIDKIFRLFILLGSLWSENNSQVQNKSS
jgi:hypothetical protein